MEGKLISSSVFDLDIDIKVIGIGERSYTIEHPTIKTLERIGKALGELDDAEDIGNILLMADDDNLVDAVSILVGEEDKEMLKQQPKEVLANAIINGLSFISINTSLQMLSITSNISSLIAKPYK